MPKHHAQPLFEQDAERLFQEVYTLLGNILVGQEISTSYVQAMQKVLEAAHSSDLAGLHLTMLPLLTCQAAGGKPEQAINVAAAWRALHIAAKLLDDVEDGDVSRMATAKNDKAEALVTNLSTGFIALAGLVLTSLKIDLYLPISQEFNRTILQMAGGQHADLSREGLLEMDLDSYYRIMGAKSGIFFALAAKAGAMCAKATQVQLEDYAQFGYNLGMMIQVADDLTGFFSKPVADGDISYGQYTLPTFYALSVTTLKEHLRLKQLLALASTNLEAAFEAYSMVEALGAEIYLRSEIARFRSSALQALERVAQPAGSHITQTALENWLRVLESNFKKQTFSS